MIQRRQRRSVEDALSRAPVVALLGPRQVGKTTLALQISTDRPSVYLDLEKPEERAKLTDPSRFLSHHESRLVILDEIHRLPEIFAPLRGIVDDGRRRGLRYGRFLVLGSASMDLSRQTSESLAGRIAYTELTPFDVWEIPVDEHDQLWLRGGFPESFLSRDDATSLAWRRDFIRSYLEREIPTFGFRLPSETVRRFWTMLAHLQAAPLNAAQLARSLGVDWTTVNRYLDLLIDLLLVRKLSAWHRNTGKRLTKSPKVYVRDSGIVHALLGIENFDQLLGHPVAGSSWEGIVVETLVSAMGYPSAASYYRSVGGAEIDLVLEIPRHGTWAIEVKRNLDPRPGRGFYHACDDIQPTRAFVVYPGMESFAIAESVTAISLPELAAEVSAVSRG